MPVSEPYKKQNRELKYLNSSGDIMLTTFQFKNSLLCIPMTLRQPSKIFTTDTKFYKNQINLVETNRTCKLF